MNVLDCRYKDNSQIIKILFYKLCIYNIVVQYKPLMIYTELH